MQTILPNSLNQLLRSYFVVFLPYPLTYTSGFLFLDMLVIRLNYDFKMEWEIFTSFYLNLNIHIVLPQQILIFYLIVTLI